VPVTYVDLSEDEERLVLASLDPLAAMATAEQEQLAALLAGLDPADEGLRALLDDLAREYRLDDLRKGLVDPDDVPPLPDEPYVRPGDLYALGDHRLLCGDATSAVDVARLLDGATPTLLATDPPYGVSLDPTWRDGVYNGLGPAEPGYLRTDGASGADGATRAPGRARGRSRGHRNTTVSGDTRVDWADAFALVPSLTVGYVWHAGVHAAEVAAGLRRIRATALFFWMGCLLGGPRVDDLPAEEAKTYRRELTEVWAQWRAVVDRLDLDVRAEGEARTTLERRYFGGHGVLLSDAATSWASHVDLVERLARLAETLASTGGPMAQARRSTRTAGGSLTEHVAERVARLAEDARLRAYEVLGERTRAVEIMERRLMEDQP
jgi:hypothetical protein